jgi:hypothetical protein
VLRETAIIYETDLIEHRSSDSELIPARTQNCAATAPSADSTTAAVLNFATLVYKGCKSISSFHPVSSSPPHLSCKLPYF